MQNEFIKVSKVSNLSYYFIGLLFLFINKIRHSLEGYQTPRIFDITSFEKAIKYDNDIVKNWLYILDKYSPKNSSLKNKNILELGPGADLGVGIITLMYGAKKYNALDVNNLVKSVPDKFYEKLFEYVQNTENTKFDIEILKSQLALTRANKNDRLNYICDKEFDISIFKSEDIDLIFSQAAFEHFDDIEKTIEQLSQIARSGTILIAEIDLKTHTRWIRDCDPLNIYRYNDFLYKLFKFRGSPNRVRPYEYLKTLKEKGWDNIKITPRYSLEKNYLQKIIPSLNKNFRNEINQMQYLSVIISACKK